MDGKSSLILPIKTAFVKVCFDIILLVFLIFLRSWADLIRKLICLPAKNKSSSVFAQANFFFKGFYF